MKILKNIVWILLAVCAFSCEEHVIEYDAAPVSGAAEFQLHYVVPVTAVAANNIYRVEINGKVYSNTSAPLTTYNAIPSGTASAFYTAEPGNVNIKLYQGTDGTTLVYDQNATLVAGKQNIFVHNFNQPPVVVDNGFPYQDAVTLDTDTTSYVKFYNFLYETTNVPTTLRLQYQYIFTRSYFNEKGERIIVNKDTLDVGPPVAFGESTGWQPVKVFKEVYNASGTARLDYLIQVVDANGNITGRLQARTTGGTTQPYADFWTTTVGRNVHHIYAGLRTAAPGSAVRLFTAN
ncbi:hypothetical protein KK083_14190 [Fulvivirgaceae bacterium PWU4]|uniref:Uncharacterized protein n=1 Tax=Chryseosolibacter histidini TaxID=2782349 RepID=A0AAP2DMM8_9BACT|nr:hypothetical protein [Chryseosolibacter histidini]MBT1698038.1 hypothetical protein [Chryseosolibacter histidini]